MHAMTIPSALKLLNNVTGMKIRKYINSANMFYVQSHKVNTWKVLVGLNMR